MTYFYRGILVWISTCVLTSAAGAHHSTGPIYDRGTIVEGAGEVTAVAWSNPHIKFTVTGTDSAGAPAVWQIETNSVSIVSRFGLTADLVVPGTRVRIAGNPARAADNGLWLTNMLLPDGREILFGSNYTALWSERTVGEDIRGDVTADASRGLFRVWTNVTGPPEFWGTNHPLTPAAAAARASYDPLRDDPTANCAPKGMPYVMEQPYPMEVVEEGGNIVLRIEEYDTIRRIEMPGGAALPAPNPPRLGRSTGRYDGATLIVTTTGIDYPFFNSMGIPQSARSSIEERFRVNDEGSRLDYEMTVTDPVNFTAPVTLSKHWVWRPGEQIHAYNCSN